MASGTDWTDGELQAAAEAYLQMLQLESDGKPYSKADVNRALREGVLSNRSKASIEYRMQNISAVMAELNQPHIRGYMPAQNVGENVKNLIKAALEARGFKPVAEYPPTPEEAELNKGVSKLRKQVISTVPAGQASPATVETTCTAFYRDPVVKAWVLQNAGGRCEACGIAAPFTGEDGEPFLEVHHMRPLANGGSDTVSNTVAACPNCHRRCHHGVDRIGFGDQIYRRLPRLKPE